MTDFVLIHGAWHGAGHWAQFAATLAGRGHCALPVDLPGHGTRALFPASYLARDVVALRTEPSPLQDLALDDVASDVIGLLERLASTGKRPTLVAHSMGGAVATRVAELAPELLAALIYVAAFVPTKLGSPAAYLALPEARSARGSSLYVGDPGAIGAVRIDPRSADVAYLDELHAAYFSGLNRRDFLALAATLTPDQPLSFLASASEATAERWGSVPRAYVRTTRDRVLPIELQDVMVHHADALAPETQFRRASIAAGHAVFVSHPEQLADAIEHLCAPVGGGEPDVAELAAGAAPGAAAVLDESPEGIPRVCR